MKPLSVTLMAIALFTWLSSCCYTAPFRRMDGAKKGSLPADQRVVVTFSEVRHQPGKRGEFFRDTTRVLRDLPNQEGLLGYSFRFQLVGRKAWTVTAWESEAARDRFARSPIHRAAALNSRNTSQDMKFKTITAPFSSLPISWCEVHRLLDQEVND